MAILAGDVNFSPSIISEFNDKKITLNGSIFNERLTNIIFHNEKRWIFLDTYIYICFCLYAYISRNIFF